MLSIIAISPAMIFVVIAATITNLFFGMAVFGGMAIFLFLYLKVKKVDDLSSSASSRRKVEHCKSFVDDGLMKPIEILSVENISNDVLDTNLTTDVSPIKNLPSQGKEFMMLELQRMTVAELLKRTFFLYRKHFMLFAGIAVIFTFVQQLIHFVFTIVAGIMAMAIPREITILPNLFCHYSIIILFYFLIYGATVAAVSDIYLGHPLGIRKAFAHLKGKRLNILFAAVVVSLPVVIFERFVLLPIVSGSSFRFIVEGLFLSGDIFIAPVAMIFTVPLAMTIPVVVMENRSPINAMKRSFVLIKERLWIILLVFILVGILGYTVKHIYGLAIAEQFLRGGSEIRIFLSFLHVITSPILISCLVIPLGAILTSLVYYEKRRLYGTSDCTDS